MEWINTFRRIGVSNPTRELSDVAQEYQRKLELRRSSISAITLSMSAKTLICAELACKTCKHPYNPASVFRLSGESKKNFSRAQQTLEKLILGRRAGCNVKEMAIRMGCSDVAEMAETVLEQYQASLAETVAGASRDSIDLSSPVFVGASITVVCKLMKFKLDRRKLREEVRCTMPELEKRCDVLLKFAESVVSGGPKARQSKRTHSYAFLEGMDDGNDLPNQPSKRQRNEDGSMCGDDMVECDVPFHCYRPLTNFTSWRAGIVNSALHALKV